MNSFMIFARSIAGSVFFITAIFLLAGCGAQDGSSGEASLQADSHKTLAEEMLELESRYLDIPPESFDLLQKVLDEGVEALGENPKRPETREEAIAASKAVSRVLSKHNFFQPTNDQIAPATIGEALTPASLSDDEIDALLKFDANVWRAPDYDPSQPVYLVDCDMGSLLIMGVFERLGWDVRLVKAPVHMFLRWRLPDGTTVNWDGATGGHFTMRFTCWPGKRRPASR